MFKMPQCVSVCVCVNVHHKCEHTPMLRLPPMSGIFKILAKINAPHMSEKNRYLLNISEWFRSRPEEGVACRQGRGLSLEANQQRKPKGGGGEGLRCVCRSWKQEVEVWKTISEHVDGFFF